MVYGHKHGKICNHHPLFGGLEKTVCFLGIEALVYIKACLHFSSHDNVGDIHYEKHSNEVSSILGSLKSVFEESEAKKESFVANLNTVIDSSC